MPGICVEGKPLWKWVVTYLAIIAVGSLLFVVVWVGAGGLQIASQSNADPQYEEKLAKDLAEEGLTLQDLSNAFNLPEEKSIKLKRVLAGGVPERDRLLQHLYTNLIVFSILGAIAGLSGLYKYVFLIPAGVLLSTSSLRVLISEYMAAYSVAFTVLIGLLTQLMAVYLFAFMAFGIRRRVSRLKSPGGLQ